MSSKKNSEDEETLTVVCLHCEKRFRRPRGRTNSAYCSDAHRQAAYRRRRDIEANIPASARRRRPARLRLTPRMTPLLERTDARVTATGTHPQGAVTQREIPQQYQRVPTSIFKPLPPQLPWTGKRTVKVVQIDPVWSLMADSLQWILRRRTADVSFVSSDKTILARCMREKGVPSDAAAAVLTTLPDTFKQWRHGFLTAHEALL
jgi:hypothetical protein